MCCGVDGLVESIQPCPHLCEVLGGFPRAAAAPLPYHCLAEQTEHVCYFSMQTLQGNYPAYRYAYWYTGIVTPAVLCSSSASHGCTLLVLNVVVPGAGKIANGSIAAAGTIRSI